MKQKIFSFFHLFIFSLLVSGLWSLVSVGFADNLTGLHSNSIMGTINNNMWAAGVSGRVPVADFGNCNALIMRCAQPKCAGCVSMEIAYPIVSGCVMSNTTCKSHGEPLIQSIAAQLVGNATARANESANNAQIMAASAVAEQGAMQMAQMQQQMAQMQAEIQSANANAAAAAEAALAEQRALMEQQQMMAQQATASAVATATSTDALIERAVDAGVSSEILAREKIGNQILEQLDNATDALTDVKKQMQDVFTYAGCDAKGNGCTGPKRVRKFKEMAGNFFDPYQTVLDEVYDALILAQSLGVNLTDIYMMLNGSCNVWGKYMCQPCKEMAADGTACDDGYYVVRQSADANGIWRTDANQRYCTLVEMLTAQDEVQQNWLNMDRGSSGGIRVACASDAIDNSPLFRNRRKQSAISIEVLERILEQDSPTSVRGRDEAEITKYCSVDEDDVLKLQMLANKKMITSTGANWRNVCVAENRLKARNVWLADGVRSPTCAQLYDACMKDAKDDSAKTQCATDRDDTCKKERAAWQKACESGTGDSSYVKPDGWMKGTWVSSSERCVCDTSISDVIGNECVRYGSNKTQTKCANAGDYLDECIACNDGVGIWMGEYCKCPGVDVMGRDIVADKNGKCQTGLQSGVMGGIISNVRPGGGFFGFK